MLLRPLPAPFVRHVVYPVYRGLRADRVLETLDRLEQAEWRSRAEIEEAAWRRLLEIAAYAAEHVPYYRDLFCRTGLDPSRIENPRDFEALPLLSAEIVRREGRRLVSGDPLRRGYQVETTGPGGERLQLWRDAREAPLRRAVVLRGYRWAGVDIGEPVAILSESSPGGRFERRAEEIRNYFKNVLLLPPAGAGPDAPGRIAAALGAWRPALLAGPLPALSELAAFCSREGIRLRPPRAVVSFGEPLDAERRRAVGEAFGAPVYARYQRPEFSAVAMECSQHGGLHVFADMFYVEVLRESGRAALPGESGELVVTGLTGRYMPLIRYRTGDSAVAGDRDCPCGRGLPLLERIEGCAGAGAGPRHAGAGRGGVSRATGREPAAGKAPQRPDERSAERLVVKSKIHKAHVSATDADDIDCLRIDERLLELGDIAPCERILIVNATSGVRLETIALRAPAGSGAVVACGAVAHLCRGGDEIGVMAFTWSGARAGRFSNILVDADNRFVRFLTEKAGDML